MSISTLSTLPSSTRDDGSMSSSHPRADGPRRRRFTPEQKLAHLAAYEEACEQQQGGAYLRREGLYSSLITEWRRLRDAGVLQGKQPGQAIGRPSKEQAEIARLRRELETTQQRLDRTETALEIMGKARALLEEADSTGQRKGSCEMRQSLITGGSRCRANTAISVGSRSSSRSGFMRRAGGWSISPRRSAAAGRW